VVIQALEFKPVGPQNQWADAMFLTLMSDEEDFTTAMDHALAGVTEGEVHTAQPEPLIEDIMDETVSDAKANRERLRPSSPLTSEPDEDEVSNIVTAPAAARGHQGGRAARHIVSNTSTHCDN
jgi:hypothetical protein